MKKEADLMTIVLRQQKMYREQGMTDEQILVHVSHQRMSHGHCVTTGWGA